MVACPNCRSTEVFHHDTEDPELLICTVCGQEFYEDGEVPSHKCDEACAELEYCPYYCSPPDWCGRNPKG